ncbi:MAG: HlyC/CorC family transporter [Acidobacteria bacterium]|nr:HlyC/CorC family transporter [Acidobacteriota bacterium]
MEGLANIPRGLLIVFSFVLLNAFFVAGEYALVRVRRTRMEAIAAQNGRTAKVVLHELDHINRYIAGVQVGITLAGLMSGRFGEPALQAILEPLFTRILPPSFIGEVTSEAIATIVTLVVITYLLVVLSELVPKSATLQFPEQVALLVARPMRMAVTLFMPLIWSMNALGNQVLRLFRLPSPKENQGAFSVEELRLLIVQSHRAGILEDIERQLTQRSLQFADLRASDVMIRRFDMVMLNVNMPAEPLLRQVAQTIHTRLPVYEGTVDNVIGILHLQDLVRHLYLSQEPLDTRKLLRPPLIVPEIIRLDELLQQFRRHHTQIAIMIDEHGTTAGLVTLEDIVEEVFGELQDALEAELPQIQSMPDGRILVRGEVRLEELKEQLGWALGQTEAATIAGYVMEHLGRVARLGDVLETRYGVIRVENMARHRITQVALLPK